MNALRASIFLVFAAILAYSTLTLSFVISQGPDPNANSTMSDGDKILWAFQWGLSNNGGVSWLFLLGLSGLMISVAVFLRNRKQTNQKLDK